MSSPIVSLTPHFEQRLRARLQGRTAAPESILSLSDFYHAHPGNETPWDEPSHLEAYLSYFLPLNVARLRAVWREVRRFVRSENIQEIWDFGSGLGATHWVLEDEEWLTPKLFYCQEISKSAIEGHRALIAAEGCRWQPQFNTPVTPQSGALATFSYSFLEMKNQRIPLEKFSHILIVEPSTRDCGRELMSARQSWIEKGFTPLAPCTHAQDCPLLMQSGRDWCHMRTAFEAPDWFQELEQRLPMKNRTLTYSYLLLSRTLQDDRWRGATRVIGDTLDERGKTRQMICRGPRREFLSWLKRDGPAPRIPHGALIQKLGEVENKGSELRASRDLAWEV